MPSKASEIEFTFTLRNDLNYSVDLSWIDFEGGIGSLETLPANTSLKKDSFSNHRWLITSVNGDSVHIHLGYEGILNSNETVNVSQLNREENSTKKIFDDNPTTTTKSTVLTRISKASTSAVKNEILLKMNTTTASTQLKPNATIEELAQLTTPAFNSNETLPEKSMKFRVHQTAQSSEVL